MNKIRILYAFFDVIAFDCRLSADMWIPLL